MPELTKPWIDLAAVRDSSPYVADLIRGTASLAAGDLSALLTAIRDAELRGLLPIVAATGDAIVDAFTARLRASNVLRLAEQICRELAASVESGPVPTTRGGENG